jgi:hypothetical protein
MASSENGSSKHLLSLIYVNWRTKPPNGAARQLRSFCLPIGPHDARGPSLDSGYCSWRPLCEPWSRNLHGKGLLLQGEGSSLHLQRFGVCLEPPLAGRRIGIEERLSKEVE